MIADILPRYQVTSDGSTVAYTVPFELINNAFVNIYVASEKQTSGYTVNVSAKTITFDNAPDEGKLITIIRAIPINWEVSDFGSLNEESLDRALTLLTAKMQTFEEELSRTPKTKPYDKETGSDLSELFFTEMRDALDSLEQAKVIYAQIQASGTQALADITTEKNSAISDIDDNSSDRIGEFNLNATNKTTAFNTNANTVTDTFNQNATDKTNAFNTNAAQKQAAIDASATAAATSATNAATSASNAATSETNAAAAEARINETLSTYVTYVGDPAGEVTLKNKDDQTLIPHTELATANKAGRVKPDGTTTSVDNNGAMSVVGKQDTLVSGTNIKTVNGNSLLGSGDVVIGAQVSWGNVTGTLSNQTDLQDALDAKADDSEVVKLTGNQNIAGNKTFTSQITDTGGGYNTINTSYAKGDIPSSTQNMGQINIYDKNQSICGGFYTYLQPSGTLNTGMRVFSTDGNTVYAITINNNGATGAPTPATSDNSTKIATTAFVKNQGYLTSHQSLSNYVTLNSSQVISGSKSIAPFYVIKENSDKEGGQINFNSADNESNAGKSMWLDRYDGRFRFVGQDSNSTTHIPLEIDIQNNRVTGVTPATSDNSTKIATTANVDAKITAQAVKLTGDQTVAGVKTLTSPPLILKDTKNALSENASTNTYTDVLINDKNNITLGILEYRHLTGNGSGMSMVLRKRGSESSAVWSRIGIFQDTSGNFYTEAPTPGATDNSTKIATTAFVNNKFQVVSALPASPTAGIFYFVKE